MSRHLAHVDQILQPVFQAHGLVPIPAAGEGQQGGGAPAAGHLDAQGAGLDPVIELHAKRVETFDGDFYQTCSCRWISRPCVSYGLARSLDCPVEEAEIERARNRQHFQARVVAVHQP